MPRGTGDVEWLRFEMPFAAALPAMADERAGLRNLVARSGVDGTYTMAVTLLDTPDHRLLRSGVRLAHRIVAGRGDWYLAAPDWPGLPAREVIDLDGEGDLPTSFSEMITPFRRTGTLGPVAALDAERREYWLRGADGGTLGTVIDERVTVRRGGLTVSRYAEVTVRAAHLDPAQRARISEVLTSAGASATDAFPRLEVRLGAPATGRTDFPDVELDAESFGCFVAAVLSRRLRGLARAHHTTASATSRLLTQARRLRRELQALSPVLDPRWTEELIDDLAWLIGAPTGQDDGTGDRVLRGERYLAVLEALVNAVRLPRIGETADLPTSEVTASLVEHARSELLRLASEVRPTSPVQAWQDARDAADRLAAISHVAEPALGRRIDKLGRRATRLRDELDRCLDDRRAELRRAAETDPGAAFELGRDYEREARRMQQVHEEFVTRWPRLAGKLS